MLIDPWHSSSRRHPGQSALRRPRRTAPARHPSGQLRRTVVDLVLLIACGLGGNACTSIYHRTRADLPADRQTELSLRVREARAAENRTAAAASDLLKHLDPVSSTPDTRLQFDRLAIAAFEFERRVQVAFEASMRCADPGQWAHELARLRQQAAGWRAGVENYQATDAATWRRQLEESLRCGFNRSGQP
jgi:hypothetical protein